MNKEEAKDYTGKPKLTLVPRKILTAIARIREYGNRKYASGGPDNWKRVDPELWRDAAFRHFLAYLDDSKSVDEESGYPHLWHLACNVAFLCELEGPEEKPPTWVGDRRCGNCAHISCVSDPCRDCRNFSRWEPAGHE